MAADIFAGRDYKAYLRQRLTDAPRGFASELARSIKCQPSYLSQILTQKAHLSSEQAWLLTKALHLSKIEADYFTTMLDFARATDPSYKSELESKLKSIRESRLNLKERFNVSNPRQTMDLNLYFSSYLYAAIHLLVTIEGRRSIDKIVHDLKLPIERVQEVVRDLQKMGLIEQTKNGLKPTHTRIHLPSNAPQIASHHTQWRLQALKSIETKATNRLHYSGLISISAEDIDRIQSIIVDRLSEIAKIVDKSKAEYCYVFNTDFFPLA